MPRPVMRTSGWPTVPSHLDETLLDLGLQELRSRSSTVGSGGGGGVGAGGGSTSGVRVMVGMRDGGAVCRRA